MNAYDPRVDSNVETDNPALIYAELVQVVYAGVPLADCFWDNISEAADYLEEEVILWIIT